MAVSLPLEEVKELASNSASCVKKAEGDVVLCLHPIYAADISKGVTEELNAMSSRYSKLLGGIPMGYEKVRISSNGGLIHTNPFMHFRVQATFYVFSPEVDSVLEGTVKKKSPHHLSCLVHKMFNISVPRPQSISTQMWYGSSVEEGDTVRIIVTNVDMSFYLPMITGHLDSKSVDVKEKLALSKIISFTEDEGGSAGVDSGISSNEDETTVKKEKVKKEKKEKKKKGDVKVKKEKKKKVDVKVKKEKKKKVDVKVKKEKKKKGDVKVKKEKKKKGDVKVLAKKMGVKDKGKIKERKKREEKMRVMKKSAKLQKDSEDDELSIKEKKEKSGSVDVDIRKEKKKKKKADKDSKKDKKEKKKKNVEISEDLQHEEILKRIKKEPVDSDSELPLRSQVLNKNILKNIKKEPMENDESSLFVDPSLLKVEPSGKCKKSKKGKSENKKGRKEKRDKMKLDEGERSCRVKKCKVKKGSRVDDCEKISKIFPSTSFGSQVVPSEKSKKRKAPDSPGESSKKKRKISTS